MTIDNLETGEAENLESSDDKPRYTAPALEKGLDVLQLIASQREPITLAEIVRRLNRSSGELFRMVQVLEYRGYIARGSGSDGYRLTDKLFSMAMGQPAVRDLIEVALPHMRKLAQACGQSCHLVLHSQGQIVVVARMESSELVGFSVRVGYRRSMPLTVSGAVLYAFQSSETRQRWEADFDTKLTAQELQIFRSRAAKAREVGWVSAPSVFVSGVTDMSAPLMRGETAAAALTIPFVDSTLNCRDLEGSREALLAAVKDIAAELVVADDRI